jgi:predicted membrane-bound spermidine synthase
VEVPVLKDFQASDEALKGHDVIFVGRPETNSALAAWADKLGLHYDGATFKLDGATYASERNSLVMAAANPLDGTRMVLVLAGNDPLHTVEALNGEGGQTPATVLEDGKPQGGAVARAGRMR